MSGPLHSAIYRGWVRHTRARPEHILHFPLYMAFLDLDELRSTMTMSRWWGLSRFAPARFVRDDYLQHGGEADLATAVRRLVADTTGTEPQGPVRMLTHLRQFGYCFNPVTFYYCYGLNGSLSAIVAQITNTPWKQRHAYVLDVGPQGAQRPVLRWDFTKRFHVSPFLPMDVDYRWRFSRPTDLPGSRLAVHMALAPARHTLPGPQANRSFDRFKATLSLTRVPLSPASMRAAVLRFPFLTARVVASIHLNALRLWLKGATVHPHPHPQSPTMPHTASHVT